MKPIEGLITSSWEIPHNLETLVRRWQRSDPVQWASFAAWVQGTGSAPHANSRILRDFGYRRSLTSRTVSKPPERLVRVIQGLNMVEPLVQGCERLEETIRKLGKQVEMLQAENATLRANSRTPPPPPPPTAITPQEALQVVREEHSNRSDLLRAIEMGKTLKPTTATKRPSEEGELFGKIKALRKAQSGDDEEDSSNWVDCAVCGHRATSICAKCEGMAYCGFDCQWVDWHEGRHQYTCH